MRGDSLGDHLPQAAKILKTTNDLVYIFDLESGANVYANHVLSDQLGYSREDLAEMGPSWLIDVLHPQDVVKVTEHHAALRQMADGESREVTYRVRHKGGHYRWLSSRDVPYMLNDDGSVRQILGSSRDVSELMETRDALEVVNSRLAQFASIAAHDLKEPLRTTASFAHLLSSHFEGKLDDEAEMFLNVIIQSTEQSRALLNSLSRFSRALNQPVQPSAVPARAVIDVALFGLQESIERSQAGISVHIPPDAPLLFVDGPLISSALRNLLNNAIQYAGDEAPVIRVRAFVESRDTMAIEVRDRGIGIEAEFQSRVFDLFQRGGQSQTRSGEGIGLTMVKWLVEAHRGEVLLESEVGVGSTLTLRLPVVARALEE